MHVSSENLGEFLLSAGFVSKKALSEAMQEAKETTQPFEQVLVFNGLVTENDLRRAKSYILGIPFVDLSRVDLELKVLTLIPEPVAREFNAVAYGLNGGVIEVAFLDLGDIDEVKFIEEIHKVTIAPRLTTPDSIKSGLVTYRNALRQEFGSVIESESKNLYGMEKDVEAMSDSEIKRVAEDGSTARILGAVLSHAVVSGATNIHIEPREKDLSVRYRLGGKLHSVMVLSKHVGERVALRAKHLSGVNLRNKLPQDGKFSMNTGYGHATFRTHIAPTVHGEKIMLRRISESASGFTLESLGITGRTQEVIEKVLHKKEGLILACGPGESGKSTFLYTVLDILNTPEKNIHTVEEPVEYVMARIHQTSVDPVKGLTFPKALRSVVTQDPDIVMVSEIKDVETGNIAVAASLSGELVLGGIKAGSAVEGILKLIDLGVDKKFITSSLLVSVGMRKVKKLGVEKESYFLNVEEIKSLGKLVSLEKLLIYMKTEGIVVEDASWDTIPFYKPRKGQWAKHEFQGHIGLFEAAPMTPKLRELVINGGTRASINEEVRISGYLSILEDGIIKAVRGLTTIEEVLRAIS